MLGTGKTGRKSARIELERNDTLGLQTFGPLLDFELHALAFFQSLKTLGTDGLVVDENVLATLAFDKAVTLCFVEPLDRSGFHNLEQPHLRLKNFLGRRFRDVVNLYDQLLQ